MISDRLTSGVNRQPAGPGTWLSSIGSSWTICKKYLDGRQTSASGATMSDVLGLTSNLGLGYTFVQVAGPTGHRGNAGL